MENRGEEVTKHPAAARSRNFWRPLPRVVNSARRWQQAASQSVAVQEQPEADWSGLAQLPRGLRFFSASIHGGCQRKTIALVAASDSPLPGSAGDLQAIRSQFAVDKPRKRRPVKRTAVRVLVPVQEGRTDRLLHKLRWSRRGKHCLARPPSNQQSGSWTRPGISRHGCRSCRLSHSVGKTTGHRI